MTEKLYRRTTEVDPLDQHGPIHGIPGKVAVTSRLPGRSQTNVIFRVDSGDAARQLAGTLGARDDNGVAAGADAVVDRAAGSSGQRSQAI